MQPATTSSSASARSPVRATSCQRCAHDGRTSRNRCNCRCAPAISSPRLFERRRLFPATERYLAMWASQPRKDAAGCRASFAKPNDQVRETCLANLQKKPFGREIPASGNDRALPAQKDPQSNRRWPPLRVAYPASVGRCQTADFESENRSQVKPRRKNEEPCLSFNHENYRGHEDLFEFSIFKSFVISVSFVVIKEARARVDRLAAHRSCNCRMRRRTSDDIGAVRCRSSIRATKKNLSQKKTNLRFHL